MYDILIITMKLLNSFRHLVVIFFCIGQVAIFACDTSSSIIINQTTDNSDGTFTLDLSLCIGSGGSADGFDLYFENEINILSTNVTEVTSPIGGNTANVTINNGVWEAVYNGFDGSNASWFEVENAGFGIDCMDFQITVDGNPEGETICSLGINENCLGFTQQDEFITCENIPGPCFPNYFIEAPGNASGNVENAGENCGWIEYEDEIVEIIIPCIGDYTFTISQDFSDDFFFGNTIYATLGEDCCDQQINQVVAWEESTSWTQNLEAGTYYLVIDMFIDTWLGLSGEWDLSITSNNNFSGSTIANAGEDQEICENSTILSGNNPEDDEVGQWSIISGNGIFSELNNPLSEINNLSIGENILQWSIIGECGESTDQITINVIDGEPTIELVDVVYCLNPINLNAVVEGGGTWTVEPSTNIIIESPDSENTFATPTAYGTYTFTFEGCNGSDSQEVLVSTSNPTIIDFPDQVYCLSSFNLEAEVDGDPGYWGFEGPGSINFSNPVSLSTTAIADEYGLYTISYYGCGTSTSVNVNIQGVPPQIVSAPDEPIFCDFNANLEAFVVGDPQGWTGSGPGSVNFSSQETSTTATVSEFGLYEFTFNGCNESASVFVDFSPSQPTIEHQDTIFCALETMLTASGEGNAEGWSVYSSPEGSNVNFSNENNYLTNVSVNEYGTYQFQFSGCGDTALTSLTFAPHAPYLISPDHQDCILEAELIAYTADQNAGPWTQISGESGVQIENSWSNSTSISVPNYGMYEFEFEACDTSSIISVGFSCGLVIPNTITPNGDGNNDLFFIPNMNPQIYSSSLLTIINRWGNEVFSVTNYGLNDNWWDGTTKYKGEELKTGVYYYILDVFNVVHNQKESYSGNVTIFNDD